MFAGLCPLSWPSFTEPNENARKHGILVVDDEVAIRSLLNECLCRSGFSVWVAANGDEALATFRGHHDEIAVVLLDVRMPGMDGPQTLVALRRFDPELRCCFMTGNAGTYSIEDLMAMGATHVFNKPFSLGDLLRILRQEPGD